MRNRFTTLLGISFPVVQAPFASASCPEIAVAVSNAGGLGMLSGTWRELETLRKLIRETKQGTDKPFGVNLVLEWDMTEHVALCLEEGVPLLSFFWGDPSAHIPTIKAAGGLICQTVASAEEARCVVDAGVDIVVAQGWEAGGHVRGQVATMALVPRVVDAVPEVPVLAAGGIADGRGIVAALALGAEGAWLGTRFLASEEARIHPRYRELLLEASETQTAYTERFYVGWPNAPHRVLHRPDDWACAEETLGHDADGDPIPRLSSNLPAPDVEGHVEAMCLYAGQGVGLVTQSQAATTVVAELREEVTKALCNLSSLSRYNSEGEKKHEL